MENHGETALQCIETPVVVNDQQLDAIEVIENLPDLKKEVNEIEEVKDVTANEILEHGEEQINTEVESNQHLENAENNITEEHFSNDVHIENVEIVDTNNKTYADYVTAALNEENEKIIIDDQSKPQNDYVVTVVDGEGMEVLVDDNDHGNVSNEVIDVCDEGNITNTDLNYEDNSGGRVEILKIIEAPPAKPSEPAKNFRNAILEDWDIEIEPASDEKKEVSQNGDETSQIYIVKGLGDKVGEGEGDKSENVEVSASSNSEEITIVPNLAKPILEKQKDPCKIGSIVVTKKDIVEILDHENAKGQRSLIPKKDLFFSIALQKRLNEKLSPTLPKKNLEKDSSSKSVVNNNTPNDDHQKIVEILEADEIKDWKPVPNKDKLDNKEDGNDLEISEAIANMEGKKEEEKISPEKTTPEKPAKPEKPKPKRTPAKRNRNIDKELERTIALEQLRKEFPTTRRNSRTTKKVNHIPFLASTILEKALTSSEVDEQLKTNTPRRRPCYLPENVSYNKKEDEKDESDKKEEERTPLKDDNKTENTGNKVRKRKLKEGIDLKAEEEPKDTKINQDIDLDLGDSANSSVSSVVRTYSVKRKSTDSENEVKTLAKTLAAATKELMNTSEEVESKPKKQKTVKKIKNKETKENVTKTSKKKVKAMNGKKKINSELEKLLGDEGAVRMLYDTQQEGDNNENVKRKRVKTTTGLKKDLMLKTKLVKNAVMRLSGVGSEGVSLRGKRKSLKSEPEVPNAEPEQLFATSTPNPNVVFYKPKKKQKAEASRILYRHSSSESFDSSEGYRRMSIDADGLNISNIEANVVNGEVKDEKENESSGVNNDKPKRTKVSVKKRLKKLNQKSLIEGKVPKQEGKERSERISTDSRSTNSSKLQLSNVPVRKSSRPRVVSKKYSIWASTSMDSLSVESLGLKKPKKASHEFAKKLNCKELIILQHGYLVQVVLAPVSTVLKNSFNLEVLNELITVFEFLAEQDSCRVVLLTSTGSTFCQGIDLSCLVPSDDVEKKEPVDELVESLRKFIKCLSEFKKVIIAGVHAATVGLGVTILPYCDVVVCSDRASFYTPYMKLGQVTEGVATVTFPRVNRLLVSELLYKSQKLTHAEALKLGLVSQILPEERFEEDLMLISRGIASQSWQSMESIKSLLRRSEQQEISEVLKQECELLKQHWKSTECINNMIKFMNSGELQLRQLESS